MHHKPKNRHNLQQSLTRSKKRRLDQLLKKLSAYFETAEGIKTSVRIDTFLQRVSTKSFSPVTSLTPQEEAAFHFISKQLKHAHSPSTREVARALGLKSSRSGFRMIEALVAKKVLRRDAVGKLAA